MGKIGVECAKVGVRVGKCKVDALVDSCASVSLISFDLLNKIGLKITKGVSTNILSIFGTSATLKGETSFIVRIGPRAYKCKALVMEKSVYPLLLGLDWLLANKCKLNFDKRILEFPNGDWKPIIVGSEKHGALPVRSKFQVILQAGERALIPARIPMLEKIVDVDGVVFGLEKLEQPWMIAKALVKVKQGNSMVEITNMGHGPWKVEKNQQLGWFEYEPSVANALLLASAIEVEDVSLKGSSGVQSRPSTTPHRPNSATEVKTSTGEVTNAKKEKRLTESRQENLQGSPSKQTTIDSQNGSGTGKMLSNGRKDKRLLKGKIKRANRRVVFAMREAKALEPKENVLDEAELNRAVKCLNLTHAKFSTKNSTFFI